MLFKNLILIVFGLFLLQIASYCQSDSSPCTALGQNASTAFPVCGTSKFMQSTVPLCSGNPIQVPSCGGYGSPNPFWYQFTCFESGSLSFTILPLNLLDDYDWQLFDITGHNPDDVYTDPSLVVTGNWAGTYGATGARAGGVHFVQCGSDPADKKPTFAAMPNLIKGHVYLLLISHFTDTQSGYALSFSGGTASITDTTLPALKDVKANCAGNQLIVRLRKKMKCSSLAPDGSDFAIDANGISILSAQAASCSSGFDMDSITLTLNNILLPGIYTIRTKTGTDENTLLDNCNNALEEGATLQVSIVPKQPTPFDSIAPVSCAPQTIQLVFSKSIQCSSIAQDGSDFSISGNNPVSIDNAIGNCNADNTSSIFVHLSHPLTQAGTYTITLKNGIDGNTVIDECGEETPALESVSFSVKDTVSAAFHASLAYGCKQDTINVTHDGLHDVNSWHWLFSDNIIRSAETSQVTYNSYGTKTVSLIVSNGFCSDTATTVINLDNELKARFQLPELSCPKEEVMVTDSSIGNIVSYHWNFANGNESFKKDPIPQLYPQSSLTKKYPVELIVENNIHCFDTLTKNINIVYSCNIAVPTAFTPNGDGINDYLYPLNAYKANNLLFTVYNRLGQKIFQTKDWTKKWDGSMNGQPQPTGTYVWTLQYLQQDNKQFYSLHGTAVLIR